MRKVLGKNIIISLQVGDTFYPVFCAKSGELATDQEEIEVTSVNSGGDREYEPGMASHTMSVTGLTELNNLGGLVSIFYLMQQAVRRTIHNFRWTFTNSEGEVISLLFKAFVRTTSLSKDVGVYSNCTASFRITGGITYSDVVNPPTDPVCEIADPIYDILPEGATTYTNALLADPGVEVLGVWRYTSLSLTTGTPANGQYAINYGTGTISFDPANPGNPSGEPIHILYKVIA